MHTWLLIVSSNNVVSITLSSGIFGTFVFRLITVSIFKMWVRIWMIFCAGRHNMGFWEKLWGLIPHIFIDKRFPAKVSFSLFTLEIQIDSLGIQEVSRYMKGKMLWCFSPDNYLKALRLHCSVLSDETALNRVREFQPNCGNLTTRRTIPLATLFQSVNLKSSKQIWAFIWQFGPQFWFLMMSVTPQHLYNYSLCAHATS